MHDRLVGLLIQDVDGYHFHYDGEYLNCWKCGACKFDFAPVGKTFSFHDDVSVFWWANSRGLVAGYTWKELETWLTDRMGLLLVCCKDTIGAFSIVPLIEEPSVINPWVGRQTFMLPVVARYLAHPFHRNCLMPKMSWKRSPWPLSKARLPWPGFRPNCLFTFPKVIPRMPQNDLPSLAYGVDGQLTERLT